MSSVGTDQPALHRAHRRNGSTCCVEFLKSTAQVGIDGVRRDAEDDGTALERLERIVRSFAVHDLEDLELLAVMQSYFRVCPAETEAENRKQLAEALAPVRGLQEDGIASGELAEPHVHHHREASDFTAGLTVLNGSRFSSGDAT